MTRLARPQAVVHRPIRPIAMPLVHRVGRDWRLLAGGASSAPAHAAVAGQGDDGLLDMLSDLAHYGLVLPLAEVRPAALLWWPDQPAPTDEPQVPAALLEPGEAPPATANRIQWVAASPSTDRWRYGVSAAARWMAASTRLPVVHHELLTLTAAMDVLPPGDICLSLSRVDPSAFAWPWRPRIWDAVQRRGLLLRERRRLALGLPAQHDPARLDALIQRCFVLPAAQCVLDCANPDAKRRLHVLAPDDLAPPDASTPMLELPLGRYRSDDPLGDNIYVLGGRRIQPAAMLARLLRHTGRSLVVAAHRAQTSAMATPTEPPLEWGAAMLAALQLDYLNRTYPKLTYLKPTQPHPDSSDIRHEPT